MISSLLQKVPKSAFLALGALAAMKYLDQQENKEFVENHTEIAERIINLRIHLKESSQTKETQTAIFEELQFIEEYVKNDTTIIEEGETEGQMNDPRGRVKLRRELLADFGLMKDLMQIYRQYFSANVESDVNSLENSIIKACLECIYHILKENMCKTSFAKQGYISELIPPLLDENLNIEIRRNLAKCLRRASYFVYYYKTHDYDFPAGSEGAAWMINPRNVNNSQLSALVDLCGHDDTILHNTMIGVIAHVCHDPTGAERVGMHTTALPWFVNSLNDCNVFTTVPAVFGLACILTVSTPSKKLEDAIVGENKEIFTKPSFFRSLAAVQVWDERQKCVKRLMDIMYSLTKFLVRPEFSAERMKVAETLVNLPEFSLSLFESVVHKNEDTRWKADKFARAWTSEYYSGPKDDVEEQVEVEVDEEVEIPAAEVSEQVKIEELNPESSETPAEATPEVPEQEKKTEIRKVKKIITRQRKSLVHLMESIENEAREKIEIREQKEKQKIMQMMQQRQQQMGGGGGVPFM